MSGGAELSTSEMVDYATQLGKALNGSSASFDGLTKKGFAFSEAQENILRSDLTSDMEKISVLSEVIAESWDGLSEAFATTPTGKITQFRNAWGDVKEIVGDKLYPSVGDLFSMLSEKLPGAQALLERGGEWLSGAIESAVPVLSGWIDTAFQKVDEFSTKVSEMVNSDEWENADFFSKVSIAWDNIVAQPFSEWWEGTGKVWLTDKVSGFGETLGSGITSGLLAFLGFDASDAVEDGASIGQSFFEGFKAGFDTDQISAAITDWASDHNGIIAAAGTVAGIKLLGGLANLWQSGRSAAAGILNLFGNISGGNAGALGGADGLIGSYTTGTMNVSAGVVNVNGGAAGAASEALGSAAGSGVGAGGAAAGAGTAGAGGITGALAELGGGSALTGGVLAAGMALPVVLGGAAIYDSVKTTQSAGFLGEGKSLEAYRENVAALQQQLVELQGQYNALSDAGAIEGLVAQQDQIDTTRLAIQHAQEELESATVAADLFGDAMSLGVRGSATDAEASIRGLADRIRELGDNDAVITASAWMDEESFAVMREQIQEQIETLSGAYNEELSVQINDLNLQLAAGSISQSEYDAQLMAAVSEYDARISDLQVVVDSLDIDLDTPFQTAMQTAVSGMSFTSSLSPIGTMVSSEIPGILSSQDYTTSAAAMGASLSTAISGIDMSPINSAVDSVVANTGSSVNAAFAPGFDTTTSVRVQVNYSLINPSATISAGGSSQTITAPIASNATGNIITSPILSYIGEDGPEAIIPLGGKYRSRGMELWEQAGDMLGVSSRDSGMTAELPLAAIQEPADEGEGGTAPTTYTTATSGGTSAPEAAQGNVNVPVNVQISPEINIQASDSMDEEDIVRIMFENIRDLVDDISDEMADRLAKVFANMPVRGGA